MNFHSLLILLVFITLFNDLFSQKTTMKWGEVSKEDLAMTVYAQDTSAEAIFLGDFGNVAFEFSRNYPTIKYEYHRRLKILKRSGFGWADVSIPYYNKERISNFKAQVILPSGEKIPIKKRETFTEEVNEDWKKLKFSFPKIEEGAIIEWQYSRSSESFFRIKTWDFQRSIPTVISHLTLEIPEWYSYLILTQGRKLDVNEKASKNKNLYYQGSSMEMRTQHLRLAAYDVPAMKEESYVTTVEDHLSKVQFQLSGYQYPNSSYVPVLSSWPKVAEELNDHDYFGDQFNKKGQYKRILDEVSPLLVDAENDKEKAQIIYNYIGNNFEWDGYHTYMAKENLNECFKLKQASSGEMNLMLLALLKEEGINARPLLVSTRGHGKMFQTYPMMSQFNHVMVLTEIDGKQLLMDAGNPNRPMGVPRKSALNYFAWVVDEKSPQWIDLPSPKGITTQYIQLNWDEEQQLHGVIQSKYEGYDAIDVVNSIQEAKKNVQDGTNVAEEETSDEQSSIIIDSIDVPDYTLPVSKLKTKVYATLPENAQVNGDFIYIQPVVDAPFDENPFKLEERSYPVEIPYPFSYKQIIMLPIPEGFAVEEEPEGMRLTLPNSGGKASFQVSQLSDNQVQIIYQIDIDQLIYSPEEYPALKNFFDLVIEKQEEFVVFKKKT